MSDLNTSIRQGDMHGAVLIYGEEPYMRDHYINSIISAYVDDAMKDFNLIHVNKYESLPQLMSLCENFPMMSDKKVVIAYDTKLFAAKKSEGSSGKSASSKDDGKQFEEFLKNIPEFCIMVFVENDVNRTKKTFKLIEKYGVTERTIRNRLNKIKFDIGTELLKDSDWHFEMNNLGYQIEAIAESRSAKVKNKAFEVNSCRENSLNTKRMHQLNGTGNSNDILPLAA